MKRLVGGDIQLDLSPIEIGESLDGVTYTSITDKSVLDQLTDLRSFIGKSGMMKPVWVKFLNGETDELILTRGSLSTSDGTTFLIKVLLVGFILTLSVEFTQAETDDHTPLDEWYIDSNDAKYILVSSTQSLAQELADFEGDVSITGDVFITGDTEFDGDVKCLENITDAQGHKRFIEIEGTSLSQEGVSISYCKASLSGTHLMLVCAGTIADETVLAAGSYLASFTLPQWIADKIEIIWSSFVEAKSFTARDDSWGYQDLSVALRKDDNLVRFYLVEALTLTSTKSFRIQFDLLVDNETPAP